MTVEANRISKEEVKRRVDAGEEIVFLDARSPEAWEGSERQIDRAIRLLPSEVESHLREVPQGKTVVAYCT